MAKIFYTERDIDDLKARVDSIDVTDNVVMTDLAVERAMKHGIRSIAASCPRLRRPTAHRSIPMRRIHEKRPAKRLRFRVEAEDQVGVLARLNGQVDERLLDAVITRVLAGMK